jgi:hypothetical protein
MGRGGEQQSARHEADDAVRDASEEADRAAAAEASKRAREVGGEALEFVTTAVNPLVDGESEA